MAISAGGVFVDLGLNSARFQEGLAAAKRQMGAWSTAVAGTANKARAALAGVGDGLALGLAGLSVGGAFAGLRAATQQIADIAAQAQQAGVSASAFQELGYGATQAQVGVDALVDGLKELQLRTDEFITTGQGSAAEAFQRLGYSAEELKTKLADPSALFEEIIERLGQLDKAAQIRIADEIFGGTGGEQFLRILAQGSGYLARMREEARATGNVLSDEVVAEAIRLNKEFDKLTGTIGNALKSAIVVAAGEMRAFVDMLDKTENQTTETLQGRLDRAREALTRYRNYGFSESYIAAREAEIKQLEEIIASRPKTSITVNAPASAPVSSPAAPARGSTSDATRAVRDGYKDLISAANERIAQMRTEQEALGLTAGAAEALRMEMDLVNAAEREGISLSPEQRAQLRAKAEEYGNLVAAVDKAAEAQQTLNDTGRDLLGGFISDLRAGTDEADLLANAIDRISDRLADMALNAVFGNGSGGGIFAGIGSVLGFAGGGYTGAGGRLEPAGVVHKGEYVFSQAAVRRLGLANLDALHRGYAAGGAVGVPTVGRVSADGAPIINVSVETLPGTTADVVQTQRSDGSTDIRAIVRQVADAMANDVKGRGVLGRAIESRYGVNPARGQGR